MISDRLIRRETFERQLNTSLKNNKIVYVGAHTGWGKTSAVMKWAENKNEEYQYISAKDIDFSLKIAKNRKTREKLVIIDDIYLIKSMELQDNLVDFIARSSSTFIVISRTDLPSWLKAFVVTRQLKKLDESIFVLSKNEINKILKLNDIDLSAQEVSRIQKESCGWAMGISFCIAYIKRNSYNEKMFDFIINDIFDYFDCNLFRGWSLEIQDFLMDICIFEEFNVSLVSLVTGKKDAKAILGEIMMIGSFIHFIPPETYTIQKIFRKFLLNKQETMYSSEHIRQLYQNAGLYYELLDNIPKALENYDKANNAEKVTSILIENSKRHATNANYEDTAKYYLKLPNEIIMQRPELISTMSMLYAIQMQYKKSDEWYDKLKDFVKSVDKHDSRYIVAREKLAYLGIGLPQKGSKGLAEAVKNVFPLCLKGKIVMQEMSATGSMPSLLNGGKDFTSWTKNPQGMYNIMKRPLETVLGKSGIGLPETAMAECLYEKTQNMNFETVLEWLNKALSKVTTHGTSDMLFAIYGIMSRVFVATNSFDTAISLIENFKNQCDNKTPSAIIQNVSAYIVRLNMLQGDTYIAENWIKKDAPNEFGTFYVTNRYRYETKALIYIQNEKYIEAISILKMLQNYYEELERTYGIIEIKLLIAITLYKSEKETWEDAFIEVLSLCKKYKYVRIVADNGIAVYEMLCKVKYDEDKEFLNILIDSTKRQALLYPNYLKPMRNESFTLSNSELEVLQQIVQGKKNAEIASFSNISLSTVKFHISNIYSKLGVNNRTQAIKIANESNLI